MPCESDPGYDVTARALDEVTRVACEMEKLLIHSQRSKLSAETRSWIERHRKWDREREKEAADNKKRKKLKEKALGKLSKAEKEAIGVY
jgi:hypothetical protein